MMETIDIRDIQTNKVHAVPFDKVPDALRANGAFADEAQKKKAIQLQSDLKNNSEQPQELNQGVDAAQQQPNNQDTPVQEQSPQEDPMAGFYKGLQRHMTKQLLPGRGSSNQSTELNTGLTGIATDVSEMFRTALKSAKSFVDDIPTMRADLMDEFVENPGTAAYQTAGNFGSRLASIGKGLVNTPSDLMQYLGKKEVIPDALSDLSKKIIQPIPEDTGLEKSLGIDESDKYRLARGAADVAMGASAAKSLFNAGKKIIYEPSKNMKFEMALKKEIDTAKEKYDLTNDQLEKLENKLRLEYSGENASRIGEKTPTGQQETIDVKKGQIRDIDEKLEGATNIPTEKPKAPDLERAKESLAKALDHKADHSLHGGREFQKEVATDKAAATNLYETFKDEISKLKIKVDNSAEIKDITKELNILKDADELAPGYSIGTEEQKILEKEIKALQNETVEASDVFSTKRTLDHMVHKIRDKQFSGVSDNEFKRLKKLGDNLSAQAKNLDKLLDTVTPKELKGMLKDANKKWSKYSDVRYHPVGKHFMKKGSGVMPPDMMSKLKTTLPGTDYLNEIMARNPKIEKHVLSQKYAKPSKFKDLLDPTEEVIPYLQKRDDLHPHIENLRDTQFEHGQFKELSEQFKLVKQKEKLAAEIEAHKKAIPQLEKQIAEKKAAGKDWKDLQKKLNNHREERTTKGGKLKEITELLLKVKGASSFLSGKPEKRGRD